MCFALGVLPTNDNLAARSKYKRQHAEPPITAPQSILIEIQHKHASSYRITAGLSVSAVQWHFGHIIVHIMYISAHYIPNMWQTRPIIVTLRHKQLAARRRVDDARRRGQPNRRSIGTNLMVELQRKTMRKPCFDTRSNKCAISGAKFTIDRLRQLLCEIVGSAFAEIDNAFVAFEVR